MFRRGRHWGLHLRVFQDCMGCMHGIATKVPITSHTDQKMAPPAFSLPYIKVKNSFRLIDAKKNVDAIIVAKITG